MKYSCSIDSIYRIAYVLYELRYCAFGYMYIFIIRIILKVTHP